MIRVAQGVALLWAVGQFVIKPLNIHGDISSPALVAAIVCGSLLLAITILSTSKKG